MPIYTYIHVQYYARRRMQLRLPMQYSLTLSHTHILANVTHPPTRTHAYMYTPTYTYTHMQHCARRRLRLRLLMQYSLWIKHKHVDANHTHPHPPTHICTQLYTHTYTCSTTRGAGCGCSYWCNTVSELTHTHRRISNHIYPQKGPYISRNDTQTRRRTSHPPTHTHPHPPTRICTRLHTHTYTCSTTRGAGCGCGHRRNTCAAGLWSWSRCWVRLYMALLAEIQGSFCGCRALLKDR